jgi:Zn finger protein HypA/HybF involved in hydrogenase expression
MTSAGTVAGIVRLDELGIDERMEPMDLERTKAVLKRFDLKKAEVVEVLKAVRDELGHLPEEVLGYIGKVMDVPVAKLCSSLEEEEDAVCTEDGIAFYPKCRECKTKLTNKPFTDMNRVYVTTLYCPECGKENTFYIDLERMYRPKNRWCKVCNKYTREYNHNHECSKCGTEVYRTKNRTDKTPAVEYYPRCPDCRRILTQNPYTEIDTVTVAEFYCPDCDKNHWLYIDLEKIYGME